ncbi:MAG: SGNH/GDSL hydrolase family protein [Nostocaceae cyanobacterium]|nr:SGNH/GDSL hydrolase family protein [Nostocaceae cyanobacterium]
MGDSYRLAATLLTGVPILATTLSELPSLSLDNVLDSLPSLRDNQKPVLPKLEPKNVSNIDISLPEFNNQELQIQPEGSFNSETPKPVKQQLASGSQLYQYRLAALQSGKIYTRIDDDNLRASAAKANRLLKYEDWKTLLTREAGAIAQGQGDNHLSVLVGDSLSLWFPAEKLPSGKFWLNQGISGDTSSGILKRLPAFREAKPDTIYVMAGINDLRRGATDEDIVNNYRQIIRQLRQMHPKAEIVVQSILPTRLTAIPNSRIFHLNKQIAVIAYEEGVNFLNLHPLFTDEQGNLRRELTTDGIHLTQRGYDVWQWALNRAEYTIAQARSVVTAKTF